MRARPLLTRGDEATPLRVANAHLCFPVLLMITACEAALAAEQVEKLKEGADCEGCKR
jgi:hypothetical protein